MNYGLAHPTCVCNRLVGDGLRASIGGKAHRCAFGLAHPLRMCTRLVKVCPAGQCGVSKRIGFCMMDGRETVPPGAGRCGLGESGWKPLLLGGVLGDGGRSGSITMKDGR